MKRGAGSRTSFRCMRKQIIRSGYASEKPTGKLTATAGKAFAREQKRFPNFSLSRNKCIFEDENHSFLCFPQEDALPLMERRIFHRSRTPFVRDSALSREDILIFLSHLTRRLKRNDRGRRLYETMHFGKILPFRKRITLSNLVAECSLLFFWPLIVASSVETRNS